MRYRRPAAFRVNASAILFCTGAVTGTVTQAATVSEWPHYGNDLGGMRFSSLTQLTAANVGALERAWVYRMHGQTPGPRKSLEVTPLMIGRALYLCSPNNIIVSLDAETGAERWRFDPKNAYELPWRCRGVAYHRMPDQHAVCAERIIAVTTDARLFAIDARDGKPCSSFGQGGQVDLTHGMGRAIRGFYQLTSPPVIVRGRIVLGGWVTDNQFVGEPSGVIRAFDVATGGFAWAWDLGRPGHYGEPEPGRTYTRGTPNSWAPMSGDEKLGLVFAPMGNATPDFWGAHRSSESEKYASSVVALDAETGHPRWSFQTVHHDLWDYDVPAQPTLIDLRVGGKPVPALIQPTKTGQIYVLDRRTGSPLTEVRERPVPQGPAQGDWLSPTQPFSTAMPDFAGDTLTERDMWGLTPFDQLWCRIKFREARYEGLYTPPGTRPIILHPGFLGGIDWGGVSVDPERRLMVVNWSRMPHYLRLIPRAEADRLGVKPQPLGHRPSRLPSAQAGTPFALQAAAFLSPLGVPCISPPFAELTVVDLDTRKVIWSRLLGSARDSGPLGVPSMLPIEMGVPSLGGAVTTRSGLVFIAATQERAIRAVDLLTGKTLWKARLPSAGHATPMTFVSPASGRQFIVIAAGGHGGLQSEGDDQIVAFAIPQRSRPTMQ